jgi:hypothetical protein
MSILLVANDRRARLTKWQRIIRSVRVLCQQPKTNLEPPREPGVADLTKYMEGNQVLILIIGVACFIQSFTKRFGPGLHHTFASLPV